MAEPQARTFRKSIAGATVDRALDQRANSGPGKTVAVNSIIEASENAVYVAVKKAHYS